MKRIIDPIVRHNQDTAFLESSSKMQIVVLQGKQSPSIRFHIKSSVKNKQKNKITFYDVIIINSKKIII